MASRTIRDDFAAEAIAMRVAVTGGSGRIGTAVIHELLSRGHEVVRLDRRAPEKPVPGVRFVFADLARREIVQPALEQCDAVCHLGEIPNVSVGPSPEDVFAKNTAVGSVILQTAADLRLKRVISTSSCQVYGAWDTPRVPPVRLPMDETHPVQPQNAYALGKVANELYARMMAERYGLSVAVFRLPWVLPIDWQYGEAWVSHLREWPTRTDGFATYVHTADVAAAFAQALENPRPGFEVYHFSAAEILSLYPLRERLRRHHPEYPPLPADWPAFKSPVLTAKARDHFGWHPRFNFLDHYREKHGEPNFA
jgi:nucleoside-diphosphate-sugar epimerase